MNQSKASLRTLDCSCGTLSPRTSLVLLSTSTPACGNCKNGESGDGCAIRQLPSFTFLWLPERVCGQWGIVIDEVRCGTSTSSGSCLLHETCPWRPGVCSRGCECASEEGVSAHDELSKGDSSHNCASYPRSRRRMLRDCAKRATDDAKPLQWRQVIHQIKRAAISTCRRSDNWYVSSNPRCLYS